VPEYLAPGVFVEETSFRAKSIEGVSTSTTGFVGPTRRGPLAPDDPTQASEPPELLTSFLDFQRIYGGLEDLTFGGKAQPNYLAHSVKAYFDNGGARLYVVRVAPSGTGAPGAASSKDLGGGVKIVARTGGSGGNGTAAVSIKAQPATVDSLAKAPAGTMVRLTPPAATPPPPPPPPAPPPPPPAAATPTFFVRGADGSWKDDGGNALAATPTGTLEIVTITIVTTDADGTTRTFEDMGADAAHPRSISKVMAQNPTRRSDELTQTYAISLPTTAPKSGALFGFFSTAADALANNKTPIAITGGADGNAPTGPDYAKSLSVLAGVEDISIVAAPGASANDATTQSVHNALITHCEARRSYRIAVLDSSQISTISDARDDRAPLDSTYAALYTPWVVIPNPLYKTGDESRAREIAVPPSGFVAGVYARTDIARGVFKAPANEVVRGVLRYDLDINFSQQETLNPIGINCLRFFPNRGNRVWGARTISSDPEWKYVNVRRYFNYLERSIDIGTQWAVFEPNGEALWANIRETITDFLINEWRSGALLGTKPAEAFFVKCDRSTMDQNDLDNGRLVCLIGVAVVKPAEFVIFRVGQKTADAQS
jgi:phage tail sheath protein FI